MAFAYSLFPCRLKVLMYLPQQEEDVNVFSWFSKFLDEQGNRGGRTKSRNTMSCNVYVYFVSEGSYVRKESKLLLKVLNGTFEVACASIPARNVENSGSSPRHINARLRHAGGKDFSGCDVHLSPWYIRPWPWKCERRHILVVYLISSTGHLFCGRGHKHRKWISMFVHFLFVCVFVL